MAQLVERVLGKDEVTGSNPVSSSRNGRRSTKVWSSAVFLFAAKKFRKKYGRKSIANSGDFKV